MGTRIWIHGRLAILVVVPLLIARAEPPGGDSAGYAGTAQKLLETGFRDREAYAMLSELVAGGPRLSGSAGAAAAVALTRKMMEQRGFQNVRLEDVMVPHWVRGPIERASVLSGRRGRPVPLSICALGGSIGTPRNGISGEVLEVTSFDQLRKEGEKAKGKIIFFNRPMDPTKLDSFDAYGGAVDQRGRGAVEAATAGGIGAIVRSMTLAFDDVPHTGAMHYDETHSKVPAAAISTVGAQFLSDLLKKDPHAKLTLTLSCTTLPDVPSANVLGEIVGSEKPEEVIVVAGHLDSWDKGTGAHDDGSGCVQAIEALRLIKKLGLRPKRTIRAVMFMNEENGNRGGTAYAVAPARGNEQHIALLESDRGGFAPRGFTVQGDSLVLRKLKRWEPLLAAFNAGSITRGFGGVDISPMVDRGVPGIGLDVENHRYFDYHHSASDRIDKVNARELELGAIAEAMLCYLIAQEGL